jgi:putative addiction module component (TIGR02574 family)
MRAEMTLEEILKSSVEVRLRVIGEIWDSVEEKDEIPLSHAQREELEARIREHEAHPQEGFSWEEVVERITGKE